MKNRFENAKKYLPIAAVPIMLVVIFLLLNNASAMPYRVVPGENGRWDMRGFDFENYNVLFGGYAEVISGALLTPEEFRERESEAVLASPRDEQILTSRLIIHVPDGEWFTFTRHSLHYAHRLYVNGALMMEVGETGLTQQTSTQSQARIMFTAQASDGIIEIVQQSSNFMHRRSSIHHDWRMGMGNALISEVRTDDIQNTIILSSFFMLSVILFLLYYMLIKNKGILYCAAFCLVWCLRMASTTPRVLAPLAPWLGVEWIFRIEYFTVPLAAIFAIAILSTLFPKILPKYFLYPSYAITWGLFVFYLFGNTITMSHVKNMTYSAYGAILAFVLIMLILKVRKINFGQGLFIIGVLLFIAASAVDIFQRALPDVAPALGFEFGGVATLLFALFMATAMFIFAMQEADAVRTEKEAEREHEMIVFKELITQMSRMAESHQQGDIDAKIDESCFEGAHKAVACGVNEMTGDYVKHITELGGVLKNFSAGDFDTLYTDLPGKKAFLNEAVEALRKNLKDVDREIQTLSYAAIQGELGARANHTNFKGGWEKLLIGLNNVMDAIITPINEASDVLSAMAEGDLSHTVTGDYEGDFILIKKSINSMQAAVSSYISEISQVLIEIANQNLEVSIDRHYIGDFSAIKDSLNMIIRTFNSVLSEFGNTVKLVSGGASQMLEVSEKLSQGAVTQSETYSQLNEAIGEVKERSGKNAEAAQRTSVLATEAKSSVVKEAAIMEQTLKAMNEIKISADNISKIIKVIEDIAFQTNLLALNASVEAARAGQHGAGFAVVAEEVRNLATRSKSAAEETTALIEASVKTASEGERLTAEAAEGLHNVTKQITEIAGNINDVAEASSAQIDSISQISQGISHLNHVTQTNTDLSRDGAIIAEELTSQSETLKGAVEGFRFYNINKKI